MGETKALRATLRKECIANVGKDAYLRRERQGNGARRVCRGSTKGEEIAEAGHSGPTGVVEERRTMC